MGFIEDFRRKKEAEIAIGKQLDLRHSAERERKHSEEIAKNNQELQLAREAKRQFEESGLKSLIDSLLQIQPELRFMVFTETEGDYPNFYHEGQYLCNITITNSLSIEIATTHDGTIRFNGDREKGSSTITKRKWESNKSVLEEALGKAYKNPHYSSYDAQEGQMRSGRGGG